MLKNNRQKNMLNKRLKNKLDNLQNKKLNIKIKKNK